MDRGIIVGIYGDNVNFIESWVSIKISKVRGILRRLIYRDWQINYPEGKTVRKNVFYLLRSYKTEFGRFQNS